MKILGFHAVFTAALAVALTQLAVPQLGMGLLALTVAYNLLLPLLLWRTGQNELLGLWAFLLPLSLFQVMPDWVLAQQLNILVFPDLGATRIGGVVPAYMAGMWVAPLFLSLWIGLRSGRWGTEMAAIAALVLFAVSEWLARPYGLWHSQGVSTSHGVALYVLVPEMLLGGAAFYAWRATSGQGLRALFAAACVSTFYTGALVISYFLTDVL